MCTFKNIMLCSVTLAAISLPVHADEAALREEIRELRTRLEQLETALNKVERTAVAPAAAPAPAPGAMTASLRDGHPVFSTADGSTTFEISGRIQADYTYFRDDLRDFASGADIRRLWIGAGGRIANDWGYLVMYDLAPASGSLEDAWISYNGIENWTFRAGNQIELLSLEQHISVLNQTFLERSLVHDAFFPGRNIGFTAQRSGQNWQAAAGIFGDGPTSDSNTGNEDYAFGARATYAPVNSRESTVHLGAALRYFQPSANTAVFDTRPENRQANSFRQTDTGAIANVDETLNYAVEAAALYRSFALQGEYMRADVSRTAGNPDLNFDGYYIQASWFPTGENRPYNAKTGSFGRVKPNSAFTLGGDGIGAFELAVRYSTIDLTDGGINGGEADNITLGINWYPHSNVKFQLNYIITNVDSSATQTADTVPNDDPAILAIRAQLDF